MNGAKSKKNSTDPSVYNNDSPTYVDAADGMIEIIRANQCHKYLGTSLQGDLRHRAKSNIAYRTKCAWSKFHTFYSSLTNKHVLSSLRLRLFNSVITPTMLYGLTTCPLTKNDYDQLAVIQRKMLKKIIGWTKLPDDEWDDVYIEYCGNNYRMLCDDTQLANGQTN